VTPKPPWITGLRELHNVQSRLARVLLLPAGKPQLAISCWF
jgi:hypothetical protein